MQIVDGEDPSRNVLPTIEAEGSTGSGLWGVSAGGLPQGKWMLFIICKEGLRAPPELTPLVLGGSAGPVVIAPALFTQVRVQIVDADSGTPIPGAELWVQEGLSWEHSKTSDTGVFEGIPLSQAQSASLLGRARAYALTQPNRVATSEEIDLVLRLEHGWRSRVYVVDLANRQLAEGINVHIDGESAGQTDAQGALWFDREGRPKRIEVGRDQAGVQVKIDPFEMGQAENTDTPG